MIEYEIRRSQRRCSVTGRQLSPGDKFISALVETEEGHARRDFAEDQWSGPPEGCIGWWRCQVPQSDRGKVYWAPNEVLISYFESLLERYDDPLMSYVMGLVLVRRKLLKPGSHEIDESGREIMVLSSTDGNRQYRLPIVEPTPEQIDSVQRELAEQLFTDHPPETAT